MATKRVNADLEVVGEVTAAGENLSRKIEYLEHLVPEAPLPLNGLELEAELRGWGVYGGYVRKDCISAYLTS